MTTADVVEDLPVYNKAPSFSNNKVVPVSDNKPEEVRTRRRSSAFAAGRAGFKETGRVTATAKCYRFGICLFVILFIIPLVFPPEVTQLPDNLASSITSFTVILEDHDCDVNFKIGTQPVMQVFGERDYVPLSSVVTVRGSGLRYVCRINFVVPAGMSFHIVAKKSARIFGNDFTAGDINIEAYYDDAFILLAMDRLKVNSLTFTSASGRIDLGDIAFSNAAISIRDRGSISVSTKKETLLVTDKANGDSCISATKVTRSNAANNGTLTVDRLAPSTTVTATSVQYLNITQSGEGPVQVMVFPSLLPGLNDNYQLYQGAFFGSANTLLDGRNTLVTGYKDKDTFIRADIEFVAINITGKAAPTGSLLWASRMLHFRLLPPFQSVLSAGVIRPQSALVEGIVSVCPMTASDCSPGATASSPLSCVSNLNYISEVPVDGIYMDLKQRFAKTANDVVREESDFAVLVRGQDPYYIKEERSSDVCVARIPDKEKDPLFPINVFIEGTNLCMEKQGLTSETLVNATLVISAVLSIVISAVFIVVLIVRINFYAAGATRVDLVLSSPETRALARSVMELSKKFAIVRFRGEVDKCGATPETYGCCPTGDNREVLLPNDIRLNRIWDRGESSWRDVKIWDIANVEFVSKLGFIFNRVVVDREGNLWGPPYGSNGLWCTAKPCGRLVRMNAARPSLDKWSEYDVESDEITFPRSIDCMADCESHQPSETDPRARKCIKCCESIMFAPGHSMNCTSLTAEFSDFKDKVESLMRLVYYVNTHTTLFFMLDTLFPSDPIPDQNLLKDLSEKHRACQHCGEQSYRVCCAACGDMRYCKKCYEVLHYTLPDHGTPEKMDPTVATLCSNCRRFAASIRCSHSDCAATPVYCERCDGVKHRSSSAKSHIRGDMVYCTVCHIEVLDGAAINCSTCSGTFCQPCHIGLQAIFGCRKGLRAASQSEAEAGGVTERSTNEELEFPKAMQRIYYAQCHEPAWEIAVLATHLAFQVVPTLPLLVFAANMDTAFQDMFGPSKGPSGSLITTAVTVINSWCSVYYFASAAMMAFDYFNPSKYEGKLSQKPVTEMNFFERTTHRLMRGRIVQTIMRQAERTSFQASSYNLMYALTVLYFIFFSLTLLGSLVFVLISCLWVILGLFVKPEVAAPYACGIIGLFLHIFTLSSSARSFYRAVFEGVKTGIQADRDADAQDGNGDPVADLEVQPWLERFGVSAKNMALAIGLSTAILVIVLIFLFVGIGAFSVASQFQAGVNSIITAFASFLVNRTQSTDLTQGGQEKVDFIVEKIMVDYRKAKSKENFLFSLRENLDSVLERAAVFYKDS